MGPGGKIPPMEIIYIDSLFFLSLLTDYLLCLTAGRLCGVPLRRGRYFLAALLGAAYAAAAFLPGLGFLTAPAGKVLAGVFMGLAAFGGENRPFRCVAALFAVAAAFGGALWALSLSAGSGPSGVLPLDTKTLVLAFALCYAAGRLFLACRSRLAGRRRVHVRAELSGRAAEFTALVDSGNGLTDPATGAPVMLACPRALGPLFPGGAELLACPPVELLELSAHIPELKGRFRLVPYTAVGARGLLPAFRPEGLTVDGAPEKELLIAVSPDASGDGFEAIL